MSANRVHRLLLAMLTACVLAGLSVAQPAPSYGERLAAAEELFRSADMVSAIPAFQSIAKDFPDQPQPWWYLGTIAFQQARAEDAILAFTRFTAVEPERGMGWVMLGLSEFRAKRFDEALVHIEQGRFLGKLGNPQIEQLAKTTQAMLCTRIGRFDVALAVLSELAVGNVKSPTVVATFGLAALNCPQLLDDVPAADQRLVMEAGEVAWLIGAKRTEESIRQAESLLQRYPVTPGIHYILGTALIRHDWERAEKEFRAELARNPDHFFANVTLASELLEQNRNREALPFAAKAATLREDHLIAQTLLGRALLANGDAEKAIVHLEKAVHVDPGNPNARYSLAMAYARAGRKDEAALQREIFARMQEKAAPKP